MRWLMRLGVGLATVAVAITLALALRPDASNVTAVVDGPVVVVSQSGDATLPLALVQGTLHLRGDCLMLGNAVVFWPTGTTWDADRRSVVFAGDFDGTAAIGSYFRGVGGVHTPTDPFLRGLGTAGDVLRDCVAATGARDLVVANP